MTMRNARDARIDEPAPVRLPRWYVPSLIAVGVGGLTAYVLTGGPMDDWTVLGVAAVVLLLAVLWLAFRFFNSGRPAERGEATYGTSTLFGLIWVALGIYQTVFAVGHYVVGPVFVAFGLLTAAAYGPGYLRERARHRRALTSESDEHDLFALASRGEERSGIPHRSAGELGSMTLMRFELRDLDEFGYSQTLVLMDGQGVVLWSRRPPRSHDAWVDAEIVGATVVARTWSSYRYVFDESGAQLDETFTK